MADRTSVNHYESLRASDVQDSSGVEGFQLSGTIINVSAGKRFRFKRIRIVITVREALGAAEGGMFYLADALPGTNAPCAAVGMLADSAPAGTMIEATLDLGEGYLSSAPDQNLILHWTGAVRTTGSLNVFSEYMGTEE